LIDSYKTVVKPTSVLNNNQSNNSSDISQSNDPPDTHGILVAINVCWFLSLLFLLLSALAATLVQQWARTYVEGPRQDEDVLQRARLRTFALLGVEAFGVQGAVKGIPILLHLALWLFLGGLLLFLFQVHTQLAIIVLIFVIIAAAIYLVLTLLPVFSPNCPYNTPMSTSIWYLEQMYRFFFRSSRHKPQGWSEEKKMELDAKALRLTINALTHDDDLTDFFSLLPKLIRPGSSSALIDKLLFGPDMLGQHLTRILHSTVPAEAIFEADREEQERRAAVCLRTTCLLARVACNQDSIAPGQQSYFAINFYVSAARDVQALAHHPKPGIARLAHHTDAILTYRALCNLRMHLKDIEHYCVTPLRHRRSVFLHQNAGYLRRPVWILLDASPERRLRAMAGVEWTAVANDLQNQFQTQTREWGGSEETRKAWLEATLERARRMLVWSKFCFCLFFLHANIALRGDREKTNTAAEVLDAITAPLRWEEESAEIKTVAQVRELLDDMIQDATVQLQDEEKMEIIERYVMVQFPLP
jgi:hypothetical protein